MITAQQLAAALRAAASALDDAATGTIPTAQTLGNVTTVQPQQVQQVQQVQQTLANVTAEQLSDLILPHVGNPAVKEALGVAMRELGVANFPEAQPHQFQALFTSFTNVLARFGIGANGLPPQSTASII